MSRGWECVRLFSSDTYNADLIQITHGTKDGRIVLLHGLHQFISQHEKEGKLCKVWPVKHIRASTLWLHMRNRCVFQSQALPQRQMVEEASVEYVLFRRDKIEVYWWSNTQEMRQNESKTTHTLFLPWAEPCSMNGWRCRVDLFIHWSLCACLFPVPPLPFTSLPFGCNEDVESWSSSSVRRALVHVWCFFTVKQSCCSSSNFTVETTFLPSQLTDNSQVKILHWKQC